MVYVIGAGPGNLDLLTNKAKTTIEDSSIILSSQRISKNILSLNSNIKIMSVNEIIDFINENGYQKDISVLATGDVGLYSLASTIKKRINSQIKLELINGISSLQYLCAKLCMGYEDIKVISLHGNEKSIVPYVCYNKKVFSLTGGKNTPEYIIKSLVDCGLGKVTVTVGERLSYDNEKITSDKAENLLNAAFDKLSVILVENTDYVNQFRHLKDEDFIRGNAPMTKECVRALSVQILDIKPTDIVYDIGAGTGSVSVCMAQKAYESFVYAIEMKEQSTELIKKNIELLGTKNIYTIKGTAPLYDENLPAPNKVFIGGSSGNLKDIMLWILEKNKFATFVINAITIETLTTSVQFLKSIGMKYSVMCINASVSRQLGEYNMMQAENPVYIIKGEISCED